MDGKSVLLAARHPFCWPTPKKYRYARLGEFSRAPSCAGTICTSCSYLQALLSRKTTENNIVAVRPVRCRKSRTKIGERRAIGAVRGHKYHVCASLIACETIP